MTENLSCRTSVVLGKSGSLHKVLDWWTAVSKTCVLVPDPRLVHCANVSRVLREVLGNFLGKVGGELMCNS